MRIKVMHNSTMLKNSVRVHKLFSNRKIQLFSTSYFDTMDIKARIQFIQLFLMDIAQKKSLDTSKHLPNGRFSS